MESVTSLKYIFSLSTAPHIRECEFKAVSREEIPAEEARLHLQTPIFRSFFDVTRVSTLRRNE